MMFANDRDLLMYEPRLFHDVSWTGQRLFDSPDAGLINVNGDRLTVSGATFDQWGTAPGWIVLADERPLEVIEVLNATQAIVSGLRPDDASAPVRVSAGSGLPVLVQTFTHQIERAERTLLDMLGLRPDPIEEDATEPMVTNPDGLRRATVFGALQLIFGAASLHPSENDAHWRRAVLYRDRFRAALHAARVGVDVDGDGFPEEVRRVDVVRLKRG